MNTVPDPTALHDELLRDARLAMESDNLAYAEGLAQDIIGLDPNDAVAWAIRAHLAGLIGIEDKAVAWGRSANPTVLAGFDRPQNQKVQALLAGVGSGSDEEKFLLIKSLGFDFWTEIFHVLGGLLLAEITPPGMKPLIDLSLTDEPPIAQAIVIITAVPDTDRGKD